MRPNARLLALTLILSFNLAPTAWAQGDVGSADTSTSASSAPASGNTPVGFLREQGNESDDGVQAALAAIMQEFPELEQVKQDCEKRAAEATNPADSANEVGNCIWAEVDNPNSSNPARKDRIIEIMNQLDVSRQRAANPNANPNERSRYSRSSLTNFEQQTNPAFEGIKRKLEEKLREAFYGEIAGSPGTGGNNLKVVDHKMFTEIFEARVSKNVVEVIGSFCLDLDWDRIGQFFKIPDDTPPASTTAGSPPAETPLQLQRKRNLETMKNDPQGTYTSKFAVCASKVKDACTYVMEESASTCPARVIEMSEGREGSNPDTTGAPVSHCSKGKQSQARACEVQKALEMARNQLEYLVAVKEGYERLENGQQGGSLGNATAHCRQRDDKGNCINLSQVQVDIYQGASAAGQKSIDEVASLSSGEVEQAVKDDSARELAQFQQRCKGANADPNDPVCQRYMASGAQATAARENLAEFSLRSRVRQENMEKLLTQNNDDGKRELAQYLKEEGMSQEKIDAIVEDDERRKKVVADIIKNFESERDALVRSMNERITNLTQPGAGTGAGGATDVAARVEHELSSRPQQIQQVIHFSNVVGSFISLGQSGQTNTQALTREISGGVSESMNIGDVRQHVDTIRQNSSNSGGDASGGPASDQTTFTAENINDSLLNHEEPQQNTGTSGAGGTPP